MFGEKYIMQFLSIFPLPSVKFTHFQHPFLKHPESVFFA
jgi:hypothetical protein